MTKTHFTRTGYSPIACGRPKGRSTGSVERVTCLDCKKHPAFLKAADEQIAAREAAYLAQTPRQYAEPWRGGNIECSRCGGGLFRYKGRTLFNETYVCSACGQPTQRPTETGMCS